MSVPAAFIATVLIWATTPLAIKWSGEQSGFIFSVTARITLSALLCLALLLLMRRPLTWKNGAWRVYAYSAIGIYGSLICVYWAAQQQTAGMISVLFACTALVTSAFAYYILKEQSLTLNKMAGMGLGILGLVVIFIQDLNNSQDLSGIVALLVAVVLHGYSSVMIKHTAVNLSPLDITAGGLIFSTPLYIASWWFLGAEWPATLPTDEIVSIVYLGVMGSVVGFLLYYYILEKSTASKAGLIPLITPAIGLWLGYQFNDEYISQQMIIGSLLIFTGLISHQFGGKLLRRNA